MSKALVLLWLGTSATEVSHEPELDSWARARWVELQPPVADSPEGLRYDDALVAQLEELLDQARLASSSLDDATARARLAEIARTLRKQPALPQSAWLMAEALQLEASVAARAAPEERDSLVARALALEGKRAPTFGEAAANTTSGSTLVTLSLGSARGTDQIYFDGERVARRFEAPAGEHHVRVVRRQRVVWAGWVSVKSSGALPLPLPTPVPCSLDDLEGVRVFGKNVSAPAGVGCPRWAVARPSAEGGIEIAACQGAHCGALVQWKRHYGAVYSGPPQPPPEPGFPAWATWALVGAGAAVLTTGVLWQAGAFDEPAPGGTRFEFNGPRQRASVSSSARGRR